MKNKRNNHYFRKLNIIKNNKPLFCIFKCSNYIIIWRFIAGKGEDNSPLSSEKREAFEEYVN